MTGLASKVLAALALLVTLVILGLLLVIQQQRLERAGEHLVSATQDVQRLTRERDQLTTTLTEQRATQAQLQTIQHDLRREIDVRKRRIQELEDENADLKAWAGQPLPAAARRLRQRPVLTGAAAYRDWLSGRNALPATVDRPAQ